MANRLFRRRRAFRLTRVPKTGMATSETATPISALRLIFWFRRLRDFLVDRLSPGFGIADSKAIGGSKLALSTTELARLRQYSARLMVFFGGTTGTEGNTGSQIGSVKRELRRRGRTGKMEFGAGFTLSIANRSIRPVATRTAVCCSTTVVDFNLRDACNTSIGNS